VGGNCGAAGGGLVACWWWWQKVVGDMLAVAFVVDCGVGGEK